ncbi:MAG: CZB domain-containing protein [Sulfuricella sp.]|nr:CZB domain-containing protein [Gammaproteobacteria bacterium]
MANIQEIDKAIGAHSLWKARLKSAISTGKSEVPVATIKVDNQCAFGQWLYGQTLSASDKTTPDYKTVKDLHAEFHKVAARVAELATSGKQAEADQVLSHEFAAASLKLTTAMMEWRKTSK